MTGRNHIDNAVRTKAFVLSAVREHGPIARGEIASQCALSATTVKRLAEELLEAGLIEEVSQETDRRRPGRRSTLLDVRAAHACALGFAVSPGGVDAAAVDLRGRPLERYTFGPPAPTPEQAASTIATVVRKWRGARKPSQVGRLLGVGIGVAGLVDAAKEVVRYCPSLRGWEEVALGELVAAQCGCEALVDEEVRCMALAETRYGASRAATTSLFAYVGRGVGAGIILDGRLYRGKHGMAGEFGHVTVKPDGALCNCGNRGCLEAVASVDGILAAAEELRAADVFTSLRSLPDPGAPLRLEDLSVAAASGDKAASLVVDEAGGYIGTGLADLINIFDPGLVVLGGEVVDAFGDLLLERVRRMVQLRAMPAITLKTEIVQAEAKDAAAVGAATLLIERFFASEMLNIG